MFVNIVQFPKIKQQEMPNSDDGSWTRMMLTQSTLVSSAEFYCSRETAEITLYQRTPKEDAFKTLERRDVAVKRKAWQSLSTKAIRRSWPSAEAAGALGSFHPKSRSTSLVKGLDTVTILPPTAAGRHIASPKHQTRSGRWHEAH